MRSTKYVMTSPESDVLPSDISMMIYGSQYDVNVKETCFGVIIDGEEEEIDKLVKEIRALDPHGIFIKDRGFPPGDPRRCRGHRGGGARPGFFMMECESKAMPLVARALACMSRGEEVPPPAPAKGPLKLERLEEIIKDEFP
ncbi:MAG: methanogenesis marker 6 protein [Methanosarcinales archaeon]|nr:methanogenesis marker 6 protein [Methanosarcinales archaeon]